MKVYIYDIASLEISDINKFYNELPKWRRDKIDKTNLDIDKLRSLGASLVLRYGLDEEGIDLLKCDIQFGENGKPYIKGNENIHFNISHSGTKIAVGIGEANLGVDIQEIRPVNLRMVDRFFTGREDKYINQEIPKFHEVWCLKESYLKCIGTGLSMSLKDIEIIPEEKMCIDEYEMKLEDIEGYKLGICTKKDIDIRIINLNNIEFKLQGD